MTKRKLSLTQTKTHNFKPPAIVARELGIPCIIGTGIATKAIRDGDLIEVNASHGRVKVIVRACF